MYKRLIIVYGILTWFAPLSAVDRSDKCIVMPEEIEKALRSGQYEKAKSLIIARKCIDSAAENGGYTPLMLAIRGSGNGNESIENLKFAKWLLEHGANTIVKSKIGATAVHYLSYCGALMGTYEFTDFGFGTQSFYPARACIQLLDAFAKKKRFEDATDRRWLPIHVVCRNPNNELFKYVADRTQNIDAQFNSEGGKLSDTPLALLIFLGNKEKMPFYPQEKDYFDRVELLFSRGIDVNRRFFFAFDGSADTTALLLSIQFSRKEITNRLLELGADPNIIEIGHSEVVGDVFVSAIIMATSLGDLELVRKLKAKGGDLRFSDNFGWSALHHAVKNRRPEMIKYLRAQGLDLNQKTTKAYHDTVPAGTSVMALPDYLISAEQNYLKSISDETKYSGSKFNSLRTEIRNRIKELQEIKQILTRPQFP